MLRLWVSTGSEFLPMFFHKAPGIIYDSMLIVMPLDQHCKKFYGCKSHNGPCGIKLVVHNSGNKLAD